jgi:hypothetical protein
MSEINWQERFNKYHEENPHIWEEIQQRTKEQIGRARARGSMRDLFGHLRWYSGLRTTGDRWKLNNSYCSFYTRMWNNKYPGFADFYELRS